MTLNNAMELEQTNYEKALILLSMGYASKLDKTGCLIFDLGYNTFGFIKSSPENPLPLGDEMNGG